MNRRELEDTRHTPSCPKAKRLRIYRDSPETEGEYRALLQRNLLRRHTKSQLFLISKDLSKRR